jgi:hypothetical protein
MITLKNRTGQTLRIYARPDDTEPCIEFAPEGHKAALILDRTVWASLHGVPLHNTRVLGVENLPAPCDNVLLIVPPDVRNQFTRHDLISPGPVLVQQGVVVGFLGFDRRLVDNTGR